MTPTPNPTPVPISSSGTDLPIKSILAIFDPSTNEITCEVVITNTGAAGAGRFRGVYFILDDQSMNPSFGFGATILNSESVLAWIQEKSGRADQRSGIPYPQQLQTESITLAFDEWDGFMRNEHTRTREERSVVGNRMEHAATLLIRKTINPNYVLVSLFTSLAVSVINGGISIGYSIIRVTI